jgi:phenylalanyl-tRNA synthetase beta chain
VPNLPASQRELSLDVNESVLWSAVESVVRSSAGPNLESVQFLDLYRGRQLPAGRKSLHFSMTFRAADRTLTHEEVDMSQQAVIVACKETLCAELRGG